MLNAIVALPVIGQLCVKAEMRAGTKLAAFATIGLIISVVAAGFLLWPQKALNELSIAFSGFTTNATGERVALFAFTNIHERAIGYRVATETKPASGWSPLTSGGLPHQPPDYPVEAGITAVFAISVPTNHQTWRVWLYYKKATTKRDDVLFSVRRFLYSMRVNFIADQIETEKHRGHLVYGPEMDE